MSEQQALSTLIGSRICHDLVSPLGAISNGLELLHMAGGQSDGPELDLIQQSCDNANARIRYFRVAFGHADPSQMMRLREVREILTSVSEGTRMRFEVDGPDTVPRGAAQIAFLATMCLESALIRGGIVTLRFSGDGVDVSGVGERLNLPDALWRAFDGDTPPQVAPAQVQFALLHHVTQEKGTPLTLEREADRVSLRIAIPTCETT